MLAFTAAQHLIDLLVKAVDYTVDLPYLGFLV